MSNHNYQRKKNNPYRLPHFVFMQTLYAIKDYIRIKEQIDDIVNSGPSNYDTVTIEVKKGDKIGELKIRNYHTQTNQIHSTTEDKAIKMSALSDKCREIESALTQIPPEYRRGVLNVILYGGNYPNDADPETYRRWRRRFIYYVALKKGYIET